MYLKRIEIHGFKSFANRTVVEFLPPANGRFSVTGIVGPNGSGKSNVTDAIRWVMGEQSMKTIRSKKSEDVIFSGSTTRGAMSLAEVIMILDNADRRVPSYDADEITLIRRLYRSGESEYLINNTPVRLLDIHLLMAQAGVAENSYSIVSQGMIDRLLTVNPSERKEFFDEACGIKELQIKRHQAHLKLSRTNEHLEQAKAVLAEIEPRLKLLTRQVKKLEERHEVERDLRGQQELYYVSLYHEGRIELERIAEGVNAVQRELDAATDGLTTIQTELAHLAQSPSRQDVFENLRARHEEAVREQHALEKQLAILEGRMQTEYAQTGHHDISWLERKLQDFKRDHETLTRDEAAITEERTRHAAVIETARREVERLHAERSATALTLTRLQGQSLKREAERDYWHISGLSAVKAVLDARRRFGEVYGVVAELGEVDDAYRIALEVAVGQHLTSLIVADESVARLAIDYLRQEKLGTATFLPLTTVKPRYLNSDEADVANHPDVIGRALDLIRFDKRYENVFSFLFGATLVVPDLAAAERIGIGRARFVTLAGDVAEKQGVMRGGFRVARRGLTFSSRLTLTEEGNEDYAAALGREEKRLKDIDDALPAAQAKLLEARAKDEGMSARLSVVRSSLQNLSKEMASHEQELALLTSDPAAYTALLASLKTEQEKLRETLLAAQENVARALSELQEFNKHEEEKEQRIFALQRSMQERQLVVNGLTDRKNALGIEAAKLETRREDLVHEVTAELGEQLLSLAGRVERVLTTEERETCAESIQKLKYKLSLIGGIDEEVVKEYQATKERFEYLDGQYTDLTTAAGDLTSLLADLDKEMKKRRSQAFKKIRQEFKRYFTILFEGGEADLEEVYADEPTEEGAEENPLPEGEEQQLKPNREKILVGIDVMANPPGKKIKYLNSLSGGERTLTSIALICAILHDNPSPFVILDEVEAALDEANTHRFVRILSELAERSQFILITHNRVTMHTADALYGVAMSGDGISQVVSVKLDAQKPASVVPSTPVDKSFTV